MYFEITKLDGKTIRPETIIKSKIINYIATGSIPMCG